MDPPISFSMNMNPQAPVTPPPEHPVPVPMKDGAPCPPPAGPFASLLHPSATIASQELAKATGPNAAAAQGTSLQAGGPPPGMGVPDPRVVAMAGKIAAHYQQRCQNVVNYQQQRCQEWAELYRQQCTYLIGAATLVVAWYMRDRISKRRRREHRRFRKGLEARCGESRSPIGRMDRVRKWAIAVPRGLPPLSGAGTGTSGAAVWDGGRNADKDSELYQVADKLIKNQSTKLQIPTLGELDLASDNGSDSEECSAPDEDCMPGDDAEHERVGDKLPARKVDAKPCADVQQKGDAGCEEEYTEYDDEDEEDYDYEEDASEYMDYEDEDSAQEH